MTKAEELYHEIAAQNTQYHKGQYVWCLMPKAPNNKAGVMFWKDYLVFKLPKEDENEALALDGVKPFTPMDNRVMNGWISAYDYAPRWKEWAEKAMAFVALIEVKEKKKKVK